MQGTPPNNKPLITSRFHWLHWLVLGASLLLTIAAWYITSQQNQQKLQLQYEFQANQLIELLQERMNRYEDALWGGVAALHMLPSDLSYNDWKAYSDSLQIETKYPGINGIGVIYYIKPDNLDTFIQKQRQERPDFNVFPPHNKDEFWPITFIEPEAPNRQAVGLDMAHESNRLAAAQNTRDLGSAQITAPIILVQDSEKTPGFLFFAPVYNTEVTPQSVHERQRSFIGNVYAPFIMKNLMDGALQNVNRLLNFSIHDEGTLLYDELSSESVDYDPSPLYSDQRTVNLYGRTWEFNIQTSKLFRVQNESNQPLIILIAGLIIEAMLFSLFIVLVGGNRKASQYFDDISKDLLSKKIELESTYNRMSCAFEAMIDGLIVISDRGIILEVNNATLSLFGYKREELLGKNISCLMPQPYQREHDGYLEKYLISGEMKVIGKRRLLTGLRKDQREFPMFLQVTEGNESGERIFTGVIHDLTEKQQYTAQISEKNALLSAAINSSVSGFSISDLQGNFVEVNESLYEWLGYTKEEMEGQPIINFVADAEREATEQGLKMLATGQIDHIKKEKQYKTKSGDLVWALLSASNIKDDSGKVTYLFAQLLDITKAKLLSLELEQRNKELVRSNAELDQFAYVASHDLKAPLNAITKLAGWIEEDCVEVLPESAKAHFELLKNRSQRMGKLLDDLLLFSRVGRINYQPEPINIQQLVADITLLHDMPSTFSCDAQDITVLAPRVPLEQILRNLIGNAIKHHPSDTGHITVSIQQEEKGFYLRVADDGAGIPEHLHAKALEMFQTLKPRDEVEGSGIGLALCKKIAECNGGSLHIEATNEIARSKGESVDGRTPGTTIVIYLPYPPITNL